MGYSSWFRKERKKFIVLVNHEYKEMERTGLSNPYIFETQSFKYQRFTPAGSEYVGMVKFEFVGKDSFPQLSFQA